MGSNWYVIVDRDGFYDVVLCGTWREAKTVRNIGRKLTSDAQVSVYDYETEFVRESDAGCNLFTRPQLAAMSAGRYTWSEDTGYTYAAPLPADLLLRPGGWRRGDAVLFNKRPCGFCGSPPA